MKIIFITPDEPIYLPVFFHKLILKIQRKIAIIVLVKPTYKNMTFFSMTIRFMRVFGVKFFLIQSIRVSYYKFLGCISKFVKLKRFYSIKRLAQYYSLPVIISDDINSPNFINLLKSLSADIIVSVSSPRVFKKELLELTPFGCINLHGSLLPQYRGILPSFWMLVNNETKGGVTVHFIDKNIDTGDIILQREFDISPLDTLDSLITKSKGTGADVLLEALDMIESGQVKRIKFFTDRSTYYSFPTRKDVEKFKKSGRKFI